MIKDHKELALHIAGKRVLLLNSLGKDSATCLHWLATFAHPSQVVALHFERLAKHPDDEKYLKYQKRKYPHVEFISAPNPIELSQIATGMYQSPIEMLLDINKWEYDGFTFKDSVEELRQKNQCEFVCYGISKYESVTRASLFYKKGILQGNSIYPIGMMTKEEIFNIIKKANIKLHPTYKLVSSSADHPSYYRMRNLFLTNLEYKEAVYRTYPLLALDEYRYTCLFGM